MIGVEGMDTGPSLRHVLALPWEEARARLEADGWRIERVVDIGGVEGGELRLVRVRFGSDAAAEAVVARFRPPAGEGA